MFGVRCSNSNDQLFDRRRRSRAAEAQGPRHVRFRRVTFISNQRIAPGGLPAPFLDGRPADSALHFMITPEAPVRLHRIRNDQLYHRYLGDPIEILMLHEIGDVEALAVKYPGVADNLRAFQKNSDDWARSPSDAASVAKDLVGRDCQARRMLTDGPAVRPYH
jgi:predicted cupin superfamily sugar epimerase